MDRRYMVKQYVAVTRTRFGRWMVFRTGDDKYYLFVAVDRNLCALGLSHPIKKTDLKQDIRRALAHGYGRV